MALYSRYIACIDSIIDNDSFYNFKRNPDFQYMTEHPPVQTIINMAIGQYELIKKLNVNMQDVKNFCTKNDSLGNPYLFKFSDDLIASCGSIRYVTHSILAIKHFMKFSNKLDIVEIGGGYGGLAMAMRFFAPIFGLDVNNYTIIDIPKVLEFQKKYLEKMDYNSIKFVDADTYGKNLDDNLFLISNYAFSEIEEYHRKYYEKYLFPKVTHGYILWNNIPLYDFGFKYEAIPEDQITCASEGNFHVTF